MTPVKERVEGTRATRALSQRLLHQPSPCRSPSPWGPFCVGCECVAWTSAYRSILTRCDLPVKQFWNENDMRTAGGSRGEGCAGYCVLANSCKVSAFALFNPQVNSWLAIPCPSLIECGGGTLTRRAGEEVSPYLACASGWCRADYAGVMEP
jgi:hypothetical protein